MTESPFTKAVRESINSLSKALEETIEYYTPAEPKKKEPFGDDRLKGHVFTSGWKNMRELNGFVEEVGDMFCIVNRNGEYFFLRAASYRPELHQPPKSEVTLSPGDRGYIGFGGRFVTRQSYRWMCNNSRDVFLVHRLS